MRLPSTFASLAGAGVLFLAAPISSAQAFGSTDAENRNRSPDAQVHRIEEIVVTATRRTERVQDTPMSISVLGAQEIDRRSLVGMGDYLNSVPGVSVLDQGAGYTTVVMRGLATNPQSDRPLTGVYFGETPIAGLGNRGLTADIKMVDLERVEVLKGPQGTLYGASSLGGAVRNIPASPDLQGMHGRIQAVASETNAFGGGNSQFTGVFNAPIVEDTLAMRFVGYRFDNSGYYRNVAATDSETSAAADAFGASVVNRNDVGSDQYAGGRISLLWTPTQKVDVRLNYLKQDIEQDGWPQSDLELGEDSFLQRRLQLRHANEPNFGEPAFNEEMTDTIEISNAVLEFDLGWASLLSSSSWIKERSNFFREISSFFGFMPFSVNLRGQADVFVQEVRLVSQLTADVQFVAGAYYEDSERELDIWSLWGGDPALNAFGSDMKLQHDLVVSAAQQRALFGEISYDLTERITLTAGARVFAFDTNSVSTSEEAVFSPAQTVASGGDGSDSTYKAAIEFQPDDRTLAYVSWSQGFRLGSNIPADTRPICDQDGDGFFDGSAGVPTGARILDSDFVDNYEVGAKRSLLNDRLQLNAAVYHVQWEGIPVNVVFDFCASSVNAGKARSRGVEFGSVYHPRDNLLFSLEASYIEAELTTDVPALNGSAGDPLPGSPEYNVHGGLQYDLTIASKEAYLRADYTYLGGFYNNLHETGVEIGNYGLMSLRAGISLGRTDLEVFVNNLSNERAVTWIDSEGFVNQRGNLLRPRTVGVSLGHSF